MYLTELTKRVITLTSLIPFHSYR